MSTTAFCVSKFPARLMAAGLALAATIGQAQTYVATVVGNLGGSTYNFFTDLTNTGTIVGQTGSQAGSYANGTTTSLALPGWLYSLARGVNEAGVIVGRAQLDYNSPTVSTIAFRYENGVMTNLGTLGGTTVSATATAINQNGTITGFAASATSAAHAFVWSNGTMTDLGDLGGGLSYGQAINDSGVVAGYSFAPGGARAFVYSNGVMTNLGTFGGTTSTAFGINNAGTVVGYATDASSNASRAFSYSNGVMTALGSLGGNWSIGFGINNAGTIVGHSTLAGDTTYHAFISVNGVMTDLNSLVSIPGVYLDRADAINDLGQIVALGSNGHSYLLSPSAIPEPADYAALLGGLGLAFALYRRRRG